MKQGRDTSQNVFSQNLGLTGNTYSYGNTNNYQNYNYYDNEINKDYIQEIVTKEEEIEEEYLGGDVDNLDNNNDDNVNFTNNRLQLNNNVEIFEDVNNHVEELVDMDGLGPVRDNFIIHENN